MACEDISALLTTLQNDKKELEDVLPNFQAHGLNNALETLDALKTRISLEEKRLQKCLLLVAAEQTPPPRRPFTGRVKEIHCKLAGAEVGNQEPYLVIATVDRSSGGILPPPMHCVLVGPWQGMRAGSTRAADPNSPAFWNLDGRPKIVSNPHDVIFLIGVVENDGASPDAVRVGVQAALEANLVLDHRLAYEVLADSLAGAMRGALDAVAGIGVAPGHLNFDDPIAAGRLNLSDAELDELDILGVLEKSLIATLRKTNGKITDRYVVTVEFSRQ